MSQIKFPFRYPAHYHCCQRCEETYHDGLALYTTHYQMYNLYLSHRQNFTHFQGMKVPHFWYKEFYKQVTSTYNI